MLSHLSIVDQEIQNNEYTLKRFKDPLLMVNKAYDLFLQSIFESQSKLSDRVDDSFHKVYLSMCMKINSDIRVILAAVQYGWYGTAYSLVREISDALLTIALIAKCPDSACKIINGKLNNNGVKKICRSKKITPLITEKLWGKLSPIKHAEGEDILAWYGEFDSNMVNLRFIPNVRDSDSDFFILSIRAWLIYATIFYKEFHIGKYGGEFITKTFPADVNSEAKEINDIIKKVI